MDKLDGLSMNIVKNNIECLKSIFPSIVTDEKIDFEALRVLLGDEVDSSKEKYQFTWNGKAECIKLAQIPSSATLRPCKSKSKKWDSTNNYYIEGDNLEVLKQLQKTFYNRIKLIYIDPPYNTGNDFVYKDDFHDSIEQYKIQTNQMLNSNPATDGRFHSNWLNLIYPRLVLARNLLTDDGAIFISIDDNEQENLKRCCDEIFGAQNFVAQITIIVKPEGRRYGAFAKTHDYMLVYAKNIDCLSLNEIEVEGADYKYFDEIGGFNLKGLRNRNVQAFNSRNRPNLRYPFFVDINTPDKNGLYPVTPVETDGYLRVDASTIDGLESVWRWGKEKSLNQKDELVAFKGNDGEIRIFQKERKLTQTPKTMWSSKGIISNKGTKEVQDLLGKSIFDFPKPLELIKTVVEIGSNDGDIVLDFFSGSATTAHAVMMKNYEDGLNRNFILVQLPEVVSDSSESYKAGYRNLCEIGETRIDKSGEQIKTLWNEKSKSNDLFAIDIPFSVDIGYKVFFLDSTNINQWDNSKEYNESTIFNSATIFKLDRTKEDILYEIMIKCGVFDQSVSEIMVNDKTLYCVGKRYMIVCLEDAIDEKDIEEISKLNSRIVVFKEDGFKDDNAKINAEYNLKTSGVEEVKCI